MPSVSKHRKIKRPTVLIKRTQCPRNRPPKVRTPSYEKLKSNNHSLARALSQEKQESQSLFSQNVALVAEVHELGFACKRRDDIIVNVLKNAKEMLKMMVTTTNYLTNTISSCQEFTSNPGNSFRSSASSSGRRDSTRRLSTKSPARGVVKPMVSGHTITKPTINLSRVNMQNIQNALSLATIEEASTSPDRSSGSPSSIASRSPTTRIPEAASRRQLNYENRRVCRMPERIPVVVMNDDLDERLSNRARISDRFSGRFSKRKSGSSSENRVNKRSVNRQSDRIEFAQIRSPRVALSDVSRLLQNSQTVNVRMLEENSMHIDEAQDMNVTIASQNSRDCTLNSEKEIVLQLSDSDSDSEVCKKILSRPVSNKYSSEARKQRSRNLDRSSILNKSSSFEKSSIDNSTDMNGSVDLKDCNESKKQKLSTSPMIDDPLEGSSWMFDNMQNRTFPIASENHSSDSESSDSDVRYKGSRTNTSENASSFVPFKTPTKLSDETQTQSESETSKKNEYPKSRSNEKSPNLEMTMNFTRFVTKHRGHSAVEEVGDFDDLDDPTIMLNIRQQTQKSRFNVDDLRLPNIESPVVTGPEAEPEITSTINIVAINGVVREPINYLPNLSMPRISNFRIPEEDSPQESSPVLEKAKVQRKRKKNVSVAVVDQEHVPSQSIAKKKKAKHKSNVQDKDPSAAKVVLQKLPTQDRRISEESLRLSKNSTAAQPDPSSDSESSCASSRYASSRPRRQKAPVNLQEPSLGKKLRRQD